MECVFCKRNIQEIDFSETMTFQRFISAMGKIKHRKRTGLCAKHQRKMSKAVKQARNFGLLSASSR